MPAPVRAALISRYSDEPVALRLYGVILVAMSLTRLWIWLYATGRPHLLVERMDRGSRTRGALVVAVPASLYLLAILIAEALPGLSFWIYAGAPVLYFAALLVSKAEAPPGAVERDFT